MFGMNLKPISHLHEKVKYMGSGLAIKYSSCNAATIFPFDRKKGWSPPAQAPTQPQS